MERGMDGMGVELFLIKLYEEHFPGKGVLFFSQRLDLLRCVLCLTSVKPDIRE